MHSDVTRRQALQALAAGAVLSPLAAAAEPAFRLARFTAEVTPPLGHALMGGGIAPAAKVEDPLFVHGLVLLGGDKPIVLAAVDWCEIRNDAYDRWRAVLAQAAGTTAERVLLTSVHQHDAPVADLEAQRLLAKHKAAGSICDLEFHEKAVQRAGKAVADCLKAAQPITHVGTGHLIVSLEGFRAIGGFDEGLVTGEDYELCARARRMGFRIINDPKLKVIHHGFPSRLGPFMRREVWHAEGDARSLADLVHSKVALGSIAFAALHALLIGSMAAGWTGGAAVALVLLLILLLLSSYLKNRHMGPATVLINAGIFYFYYAGRAYSILRRFPRLLLGRNKERD